MSKRKDASGVGRRGFLKGAALAGAATTVVAPLGAIAQPQAPKRLKAPQGISAIQKAAETSKPVQIADLPKGAEHLVSPTSGSDFMVDAYKSLGIEYIASMPGSSFRGLQESFINYGKNSAPEWLTTLHEEISVAMAQGYAKGTVFAIANPEAAIRILWEVFPQTKATGKTEADAMRDDVKTLEARAKSWRLESVGAKKWGDNSVENYGAYIDFLVKNGLLKEKAATTDLITNDLIDDINKFDVKEIETMAKGWKG